MKFISITAILLFSLSMNAQFLFSNKEDSPGHKFFLHGEVDYKIFLASFGFIAEYTSKDSNDESLINFSIGFKAHRSFMSFRHITAVDFESYYGPQLGLQLGRKRHMLESTINYGHQHINKTQNTNSESGWIYQLRIGYRNQGDKILYRLGIKWQDDIEDRYGIYMSFGQRLF